MEISVKNKNYLPVLLGGGVEINYTQGAYFKFQMGKRVHDDLVGIFLFCMPCALVPAPFQGNKAPKRHQKKGKGEKQERP